MVGGITSEVDVCPNYPPASSYPFLASHEYIYIYMMPTDAISSIQFQFDHRKTSTYGKWGPRLGAQREPQNTKWRPLSPDENATTHEMLYQ